MAIYNENIVDIELTGGNIFRSFLSHTIGSGDVLANRFGVRVFRNGEPENIGGTCFGLFVRADGTTVTIASGVVSGNEAYVTLPESCYAVEGQFTLAIKCQGGGTTGTLRIVDGVVSQTSTDAIVDPGTIIPSVEALINAIDEAVASIPSDYSSLSNALTYNGFAVPSWENGSISDINGSDVSSSDRIRTKGYIPRTSKFIWSENQSGNFGLYAWNENGSFVGMWKESTGTFVNDATASFLRTINIGGIYENPAYYKYQYKLVYRITNGSVQIDTVAGVHIDTYMPDLPQIQKNTSVIRAENFSKAENINDSALWEMGGIASATGLNIYSGTRVRTRVFIPTNAGLFSFGTQAANRGLYLYAYDTAGDYIGAYKKATGTFVTDGTETGYNTETAPFDIGSFMKKYPGYRFRFYVYGRGGSDVSITDCPLWTMTSVSNDEDYANIKVIQYNIGKFNYGIEGGLSAGVLQKIMNYKEFFAGVNADFICMQEYVPYIDSEQVYPSDATLFTPVLLEKSYSEHETVIFGQRKIRNSQFTYIHTSGDNPAWVIFGETTIAGKRVAIASGALNSSAPEGIDHQQQGIRALTKLTEQILADYDYAIVCMDCNTLSNTESDAFKSFMDGKGYVSGNWNYFGYKDTYNLSSTVYKAIDNVFVKGSMKIVSFSVPDVYADLSSDHFPVVADIRIK